MVFSFPALQVRILFTYWKIKVFSCRLFILCFMPFALKQIVLLVSFFLVSDLFPLNHVLTNRYILDDDLQLKSFLEEHDAKNSRLQESNSLDTKLSWVPYSIKGFVLPEGFPGDLCLFIFSIILFFL